MWKNLSSSGKLNLGYVKLPPPKKKSQPFYMVAFANSFLYKLEPPWYLHVHKHANTFQKVIPAIFS